jgi:uncharacterized iron-regulated membrane protein
MKTSKLLRLIHNWGSIIIAIPVVIMIGAGILLMLKKEFEWIQPSSEKGAEQTAVPTASIGDMWAAAKAVEKAGFTTWAELKRADLKPDKGILKLVSPTDWEVQVDTTTAKVLNVAERRSDIIEKIHDGSWFAEPLKLWFFLPVGIVLFVLWLTGLYMFFLPYYQKAKKSRDKAARLAAKTFPLDESQEHER